MSKDDLDILEHFSPVAAQEGEPDYNQFLPLLADFELSPEQEQEFMGIIVRIAWHFVRGGWNDVDMSELIVSMALAAKEAEDLSGEDSDR